MKISVDPDVCCGAGQCALLAPDVFDQRDDDGVVFLLEAEPPEGLHALAREAASMCPTGAIELDTTA